MIEVTADDLEDAIEKLEALEAQKFIRADFNAIEVRIVSLMSRLLDCYVDGPR